MVRADLSALQQPPRAWAERTHNVRRYTKLSAGRHFAPIEQPTILAADIRAFFADTSLGGAPSL